MSGRKLRRRPFRGGVLLLVVLCSSMALFGQPPVGLTADVAARLRRNIEGGSNEDKRAALFEIRNMRSAPASAIAFGALNDSNEVVRATAAGSVVFSPDAAAALIPLLNDKDEFVRREAAYALGTVRDASAAGPLVRLMQSDKILEVKTAAAVALGNIGDASAIDSLLKVLRSRVREDDEFLRRSAARSIGQIAQKGQTGDTSGITPQNFLPDKFKKLEPRISAGSFSPAVDVLLDVLRNKSESDDTRREAAYSLGAIGDSRAVATLQTFVNSPDPYLAEICREALLKISRGSV